MYSIGANWRLKKMWSPKNVNKIFPHSKTQKLKVSLHDNIIPCAEPLKCYVAYNLAAMKFSSNRFGD